MRGTGYAYRHGNHLVTGVIDTGKLKSAHRLFYIRMQLGKVIDACDPTLVVMEDYAMGAGGKGNNNVFNIGELGGVLKLHLWENGFNVLPIAPTSMKSVIALNGRADKKDISHALARRFNIHVNQPDEADAVGLMLVGEMRLGLREATQEKGDKAKSSRFESVRQIPVLRGRLNLISKSLGVAPKK